MEVQSRASRAVPLPRSQVKSEPKSLTEAHPITLAKPSRRTFSSAITTAFAIAITIAIAKSQPIADAERSAAAWSARHLEPDLQRRVFRHDPRHDEVDSGLVWKRNHRPG